MYLKKILYGMPSDEFDFKTYAVGGCIPSEASVRCSKCDWEDESSENMTEKPLWVESE